MERENKSVYLCTRFKREGGMIRDVSKERIGSETFWEKIFEKRFGRFEKGFYLCSPQRGQRRPWCEERGSEVFELKKIFQKDLEVSIKVLTFAPLSAEKSSEGLRGRAEVQNPLQNKTCSYSNIKDSVLWSTWAAKVFHSCKRVISNNTFEIWAKDLTKHFIQWRVWSWLRMNASGRLNTCKSRGSGIEACFNCRRPAHGCVTRMQPTQNRGITLRNWY